MKWFDFINKKAKLPQKRQELQKGLILALQNTEEWQREARAWREEAQLWRNKYLELEEKKAPVYLETKISKKIKTTFSDNQNKIYNLYLKLKENPNEKCTTKRIAEFLGLEINACRVKIDRIQKKLEARREPRMEFDFD